MRIDPIEVQVGTQVELWAQFLVDEVQALTPSGSPTGGTVDLETRGKTATLVPVDATALDVQEALCSLPNIGPNGVICYGGPWPSAAIQVKFTGPGVGKRNHPLIAVTNNLSGGTSPAVTVTTVQPGGLIEPSTVEAWVTPPAGAATALSPTSRGAHGVWEAVYTPTVEGVHTATYKATSITFGTVEVEQVFTARPRAAMPTP